MDFETVRKHARFLAILPAIALVLFLSGVQSAEDVLDTMYPIVIAESKDPSQQLSKTFFGLSVSISRGKVPPHKVGSDPDGWIFIGAPKANDTPPLYSSKSSQEPGVVWRCSLGRKDGDKCERVNVDPAPYSGKRPGAPFMERHDAAFIGSSMEINYNHFLACGHHWVRGEIYYNGICYWFPASNYSSQASVSYIANDLSILVDKRTYEQRLTPLFETLTKEKHRYFYYDHPKNGNTSGYEWIAGLAGMSVHLFKTSEEAYLPSLLIGAPGVREFSGAVVLYSSKLSPNPNQARPNRNPQNPVFSEFVVGNFGDLSQGATFSQADSYLGYSVSSGKYFAKDQVVYAAGAPRVNLVGQVVIFDLPKDTAKNANIDQQIITKLTLQAPQNAFTSYFGSVLHSADFDGDGLDELVVGAPLLSWEMCAGCSKSSNQEKHEELSKRGNIVTDVGDQGAVYIYKFNTTTEGDSEYKYSVHNVTGRKVARARFGTAISSIEFPLQNKTRLIYLVVGAPYETGDSSDSSGAVYLYQYIKASNEFKLAQRITASKISPNLKGFGVSLGLPADIDGNDTPDMSIGSFKSGHVVVLRTRPKITITSWMTFTYEGHVIQEVRRGIREFYFQSCFRVDEQIGLLEQDVEMWVKIRFSDRTISFQDKDIRQNPGSTKNMLIYKRSKFAYAHKNCENLTIVSVQRGGIGMDDTDDLKEIKQPFQFVQEVWYNDTLTEQQSVLTYYVTDASSSSQRQRGSVDFQSFQSKKPSAQKTTTVETIPIAPTDCAGKVCQPKLAMAWSFVNSENKTILNYMLGSESKEITMRLFITNTGETGIKPTININWNNTHVKESATGWLHTQKCEPGIDGNKKFFICPLIPYFKNGRNMTIDIPLNMDDVYVDREKGNALEVSGTIYVTDSRVPTESATVLPLYAPSTKVVMMGTPLENATLKGSANLKAMWNQKEVALYPSFRQKFTIEVRGASVSSVMAKIKIPILESSLGDEPVIYVRKPQVQSNIKCTPTPNSKFDFLNIGMPAGPLEPEGIHKATKEEHLVAPEIIPSLQRRRRRDVNSTSQEVEGGEEEEVEERARIAIDMTPPYKEVVKPDRLPLRVDDGPILNCDSEANCLEITCNIENVKAYTHVHIPFELHPTKAGVDTLMKKSGKAIIFVESSGWAQIFSSEENSKFYEAKDLAQTALTRPLIKAVEIWVYFVAGFLAILVLALIVAGLYKCGFFKREKRQQLNNMKAEHHRKSMAVAAVRASMMIPSGLGGSSGTDSFDSQENLTKAEHQNEDADDDDVTEEKVSTEVHEDEKS